MRWSLRWLWIGLLIITLPLKGLAAVGHWPCLAHAPQPTPMQQAEEACAHHASQDGEAKSEPAAEAAPSVAQCTQCAPCCAAVAPSLEPAAATPSRVSKADAAIVLAPSLPDEGQRLERPPRPAFA